MLESSCRMRRQAVVDETVKTEVALDDCGGHVMLSLKCGDDRFCQALSARDMGKVLAICDQCEEQVVCCEGDLVVSRPVADRQVVEFTWQAEGGDRKVVLEPSDLFVVEWACRSYCRALLRTNRGL